MGGAIIIFVTGFNQFSESQPITSLIYGKLQDVLSSYPSFDTGLIINLES